MKKDVKIGKYDIELSASAFTPFSYKKLFQRDLLKDIQQIQKDSKSGGLDAEIVSMVTYTMAKEVNKDIEPFEEWLGKFEIFDLYESFNEVVTLWGLNAQQNSVPRKK